MSGWYDDYDSWGEGLEKARAREAIEDADIRDPSVAHALAEMLAKTRGETPSSEEGEARRAVAGSVLP